MSAKHLAGIQNRKCRTAVSFPKDVHAEIEGEARRLNESVAWVMQVAWSKARKTIKAEGDPR